MWFSLITDRNYKVQSYFLLLYLKQTKINKSKYAIYNILLSNKIKPV